MTFAGDEQEIRTGYRNWIGNALVAVPVIAATAGDVKWTVAVSAAVLIFLMNDAGARLYDLCIRLRRTNVLLAERDSRV